MKFLLAATSLVGLASAFAPTSVHTTKQSTTSLFAGKDSGDKSKALPFAPRPPLLDGSLAGDVGFE